MDSIPRIIEVAMLFIPALLAHGTSSNSPAPASPCLSGFPAWPLSHSRNPTRNIRPLFTSPLIFVLQSTGVKFSVYTKPFQGSFPQFVRIHMDYIQTARDGNSLTIVQIPLQRRSYLLIIGSRIGTSAVAQRGFIPLVLSDKFAIQAVYGHDAPGRKIGDLDRIGKLRSFVPRVRQIGIGNHFDVK